MSKRRKSNKLLGQTLADKYLLETIIGEGGFGTVFSARNIENNQKYAIKILDIKTDSLVDQEKDLQYFQREVGILSRVQHPAIVNVFEVGIFNEILPYLVMELAEGELLSNILRTKGAFSLEHFLSVFTQLCQAVAAMHKQAIIHRDLKPENIIINNNSGKNIVKLLDFGLAKLIGGEREEKWLRTLTGRGKIHGTIFYMSPEQCEGKKLDHRTDIYSLGILAYEMLTSQPPFYSPSSLGVMMMHLEAPPPPLRSFRKDVPVELEIALLKALAKNCDERYSSVEEFILEIEKAIAMKNENLEQYQALANPNSPSQTVTINLAEDKKTSEMDINSLRQELQQSEVVVKKQVPVEPEKKPQSNLSQLIDMFNKIK